MPIQRTVLNTERKPRLAAAGQTCLDCPDCTGACWSVIELAVVPEWVLRSNRIASA